MPQKCDRHCSDTVERQPRGKADEVTRGWEHRPPSPLPLYRQARQQVVFRREKVWLLLGDNYI
jgi:hypothetical protein